MDCVAQGGIKEKEISTSLMLDEVDWGLMSSLAVTAAWKKLKEEVSKKKAKRDVVSRIKLRLSDVGVDNISPEKRGAGRQRDERARKNGTKGLEHPEKRSLEGHSQSKRES